MVRARGRGAAEALAGDGAAVYAFALGLMEDRVTGNSVQTMAFFVLLALIFFTAASGMQ